MKNQFKILATYVLLGAFLVCAIVLLDYFDQIRHPMLPMISAYIITLLSASMHYASFTGRKQITALSSFSFLLMVLMSLPAILLLATLLSASINAVLYSLMMINLVALPSSIAVALAVRIVLFRKTLLKTA